MDDNREECVEKTLLTTNNYNNIYTALYSSGASRILPSSFHHDIKFNFLINQSAIKLFLLLPARERQI